MESVFLATRGTNAVNLRSISRTNALVDARHGIIFAHWSQGLLEQHVEQERCVRSQRSGSPDDRPPSSDRHRRRRLQRNRRGAPPARPAAVPYPAPVRTRLPAFARGAAYATPIPLHLLNVRAANMSAYPDRPTHFLEWLQRLVGQSSDADCRVANPGDRRAVPLSRGISTAVIYRRSCAKPSARIAALCACASFRTRWSIWSHRPRLPPDAGRGTPPRRGRRRPRRRPSVPGRERQAVLTSSTHGRRPSRRTSTRTGPW